jgi:hypothetical protein
MWACDKVGREKINKEKKGEKKGKKGILDLSSFSPEGEAVLPNGSKNSSTAKVNILSQLKLFLLEPELY